MSRRIAAPTVSEAERRELEDFLLEEADLLDAARYDAWIELVAEDVRYTVDTPLVTLAEAPAEVAARRVPLFDEDVHTLRARVAQFLDPAYTVAENPRSIDRRFVSNVRVARGDEPGTYDVRSNLLLRRSRGLGCEPRVYSAARRDRIRRRDGALELARRSVALDDPILQARSLSILF